MRVLIVSLFIVSLCFGACEFTAKQNALHPSLCKPFKEGTFYNEAKTYKVERTGNTQIEYDLINQLSYHFEVHWLYDCAYNLTFKHSNNKIDTFGLKPKDMLRIQFVETSDTSFTYEVDFNNDRFKNTLYKE